MMNLSAIQALSDEAAEAAAAENLTPYVYWNTDEVDNQTQFPFPFIGSYKPEGWVEIDRHFVDSSGFGQDDEWALSESQFINLIRTRVEDHPGVGWAVVEAGQFQVYVGEFDQVV